MTAPLVTLIILDGFGLAPAGPGNAVHLAATPVFDAAWANHPHTTLSASGLDVGLPAGQMGNSEVGHVNLGAGRVVAQSLTFIDEQIRTGAYFQNIVLQQSATAGATWHLVGLVSDGGVHSSLAHLLALIDFAEQHHVSRVRIHVITDGRDTAPDSGLGFVQQLNDRIAKSSSDVRVASVVGRYYAMDRDQRWERTKLAYDAIVHGTAEHTAATPEAAITEAYARGETDEFILPTLIPEASGEFSHVRDGDSVFFFNFRADRMRQLAHAVVEPATWMAFERGALPTVHAASLMEYQKGLALPYALSTPELIAPLAQVISDAGYAQFHAAETEKYAHVTYFFNAHEETPFPGEERLLVPSPQVATYDLQPAMSAPELAAQVAARIQDGTDRFVLINFANPDMVGHTGDIAAAIAACEATDSGLGEVLAATTARGGVALIVADHGNAEQMLAPDGSPHTAHTTNPVPFVLYSDDPTWQQRSLRDGGRLADVAPTVLEILGLAQPAAMTGESVLKREERNE